MTAGIEAIHALAMMGYRAWVEGQEIFLHYEGPGQPDRQQAKPLVDVVKRHKEEVRHFLKCYCPRCGGMVFGTFAGVSRCMACYWEE